MIKIRKKTRNHLLCVLESPAWFTCSWVTDGSLKFDGSLGTLKYQMLCAICYNFVLFKKREKHPWKSVTFSKLQTETCNFTKSNTPPWMFFTFIKLYKWYHIAQRIIATYRLVDVATRKLFGLQFIDLSHGDSQITGPYFLQSKSCVNGIWPGSSQ